MSDSDAAGSAPASLEAGGGPAPLPRPAVPRRRIRWRRTYRLVPTRFPPVDVFERVAPPEDWDALIALESLTNPRLRQAAGDLALVPPGERVSGPGASYVMAPFTHLHPAGGRFTTPHFGGYYTARDQDTAVAETRHHREAFLRATAEAPIEVDMRVLEAALDGRLVDLRTCAAAHADLLDADDYAASQAFARAERAAGSDGVAWPSVRRTGGQCAVAWRPRLVRECREVGTLTYVWNGEAIDEIYEKRAYRQAD